ncbi:MAG TPA: acyl-CoA thioesterase [Acidobacteriota bacterium]|nr:acyl-CoA thioesterase [Acidobacteriota bacterium]
MSATAVHMTEMVMPNDTNPHGTVSGGRVMQLIDICGAVAAVRHARRQVVTASFDDVAFVAPVPLGHILLLDGLVTCTGSTSMEVRVIVRGENPLTGAIRQTTTAYLTFVALDGEGRPAAVPDLIAESDEERELMSAATRRRHARLARYDHG